MRLLSPGRSSSKHLRECADSPSADREAFPEKGVEGLAVVLLDPQNYRHFRSISYPRVDETVEEINHKRDYHNDEAIDNDCPLYQRIVLDFYRINQEQPHSIPIKSRLGKDRPRKEYRELQP